MFKWLRKPLIWSAAAACAVGMASAEVTSIKIGAVAPKTGGLAGGAAITHWPNVQLWVHEVNAKGGIMLKSEGKRVPIELVEYDDRTSNEDAVRAVERLATVDKADFILAPYGTGANLATGPLFNKYGYPQLAVTAVTDKGPDLAKRWPNSFYFLGGGTKNAGPLIKMLEELNAQGKINNKIAVISAAEGFGIDMARGANAVLKNSSLDVVYNKTYPLGTQDFTPMINEAKRQNPDTFIAFSYPPGTMSLPEVAKVAGFNPKVFYVGVAGAFPIFIGKYGEMAEGVMGVGGADTSTAAMKGYIARHKEVTGKAPDAWASPVLYASFQMLEQAIERVGSLDREAVTKEIQTGTFDTVIGTVKLNNNILDKVWAVGQWQGGEFKGVAPTNYDGAVAPVVPKPSW